MDPEIIQIMQKERDAWLYERPPIPPKKASVTLTFDSEKDKSHFMLGMCDGWGEGLGIDLQWDGDFQAANTFHVREVPEDDEDDDDDDDFLEKSQEDEGK